MVTIQMTRAARRAVALDALSASGVAVTAVMSLVQSLAVRAITVHVDNVGLCAACGSSWPCWQARLAEHNLAVL